MMLKIIAYTGGHNAPSRVPRVQHYIGPLKAFGVDMRECPSHAGLYPPNRKWLRPLWGLWNLSDRLPDVLQSLRYDISFFQRELLSTFVTWEPFTKRPRVFDIDDAVWVHRSGHFARRLARLCDHIICGNRFLAEEFSRWNPNVAILPTPVDTSAFFPAAEHATERRPILGWMGLSRGYHYLYGVERALDEILRRHPEAVLRIVSDRPPRFQFLPANQLQFIRWTAESQVRMIQEMTIGIMPLDNTVISRGKCSFKMLLYMACGLPVVVTPVGMNADVLQEGRVGFGAASECDWVDHLDVLLRDPELALQMGRVGREVVLKKYSVDALAPQFAKILWRVTGRIL
jgi:glycosyltransferase involved in cell wall biosynthesis